jgi:hypothetical protein
MVWIFAWFSVRKSWPIIFLIVFNIDMWYWNKRSLQMPSQLSKHRQVDDNNFLKCMYKKIHNYFKSGNFRSILVFRIKCSSNNATSLANTTRYRFMKISTRDTYIFIFTLTRSSNDNINTSSEIQTKTNINWDDFSTILDSIFFVNNIIKCFQIVN